MVGLSLFFSSLRFVFSGSVGVVNQRFHWSVGLVFVFCFFYIFFYFGILFSDSFPESVSCRSGCFPVSPFGLLLVPKVALGMVLEVSENNAKMGLE